MNRTRLSTPELPGVGWQLYGQIELPARPAASDLLEPWLAQTLEPLRLPAGFRGKILQSARDAVGQARQSFGPAPASIRLLLYTPQELPAEKHTWGFFRLERAHASAPGRAAGRAIAFYLYPDR